MVEADSPAEALRVAETVPAEVWVASRVLTESQATTLTGVSLSDDRQPWRPAHRPTEPDEDAALGQALYRVLYDAGVSFESATVIPMLSAAARAVLGAEPDEDNWEYGIEYEVSNTESVFTAAHSRHMAEKWVAESPTDTGLRRRRPAGPWEPVTPIGEDR
jgi:hypothetical protein